MAKAVSISDLQELQKLLVDALKTRLEQDIEDNLPTDAATLGVITKLLKDNSITADPADADDLSSLREKLTEQARQRRERASNVVALVQSDLDVMTG